MAVAATANYTSLADTIYPEFLEPIINNVVGAVTTHQYGQIITDSYGKSANIIASVKTLAESFIPIGLLMLALFWSASLLSEVLSKDLEPETIIWSLFRLAIGAIIVSNSVTLFMGLAEFGDALITDITGALAFPAGDMTALNNEFVKLINTQTGVAAAQQLYGIVVITALTVMQSITNSIIPFFLTLYGWTRSMRLTQMFLYCPIGFSNIYQGGMNSPGMQFARKFFAVLVEPLVVYIAIMCYVILSVDTTLFAPALSGIINFALMLAAISFIRKAQKITQIIFC